MLNILFNFSIKVFEIAAKTVVVGVNEKVAEMTASEVDYIGQTDVLAGQFEILSLPTEKNGLHYRRSRVQAKRLTVLRSRRNLKKKR